MMKKISAKAKFLLVPVVLLALTSCNESKRLPQDSLDPKGYYARVADNLWNLVFPIAVFVFFLVQLLVLWLVIRYRRKSDDESPKQVHGNTKMEIGWTILPALLLAFVGVQSIQALWKLSDRPAASTNPVHVQVIGHQWWWEFSYPKRAVYNKSTDSYKETPCIDISTDCVRSANELVIPVGRPVDVQIQSKDVIHSFWVPSLAGKMDATVGQSNYLTLKAEKPGEYFGQCAEFCGLSHANMRFRVRALTAKNYEAWWNNQLLGPANPTDTAAQAGAVLFTQKGCAGCHMINGVSKGNVGPNLTHFDSRHRFAGSLFVNNTKNLRSWLRDPPEEKPGSLMPNLNLTEDEITNLIAYLQQLK
jgi:cytochrome c oxidase subunit 2